LRGLFSRHLLARRPEAIVLTGAIHSRAAARMLLAANIPVIEITNLPRQPVEYAIGFSNYEAAVPPRAT
jgi:LacI family transcriptional regulator, gluconate utilization system Gnt-I transcriptional repressor